MSNEEKFRDTLNEKLASKDFAFDETNWENARMLLDANKPQRRVIPFLLAAFVLILTGTGTWIAFMPLANDSPVTQQQAVKITGTEKIKTNVIKKIPAKENAVVGPAKMQANSNPHKPNQAVIKDPVSLNESGRTAADKDTPASKNETHEPVSKTIPPLEKVKVHEPVNLLAVVAPAVLNNQKTAEEKAPQQKNNSVKAAEDLVSNNNETKIQQDQNADDATRPIEKATTNPNVSNTTQKTDAIVSVPTTNAAPISSTGGLSKNEAVNNGEQIATDQSTIATSATVSTNATAPKDTIAALVARPDTDYVSHRKFHFNVEGGGAFLKGWKTPEGSDAAGVNPFIGINYISDLGNSIQFLIGAQYTSVGNLHGTTYTAKISRLGLGEESRVSVYTPLKMHYLIVPLRLEYAHDFYNHFGVGLNVAYLLTMESKLETYDQKLNSISNYQTSKVTGYTEGFRNFDYQISCFYKRRLYNGLFMNAELIYGLTDVKADAVYATKAFERHVGIKVGFVYNLFKETK
jgi:hypothetical protein